jgi:3'-phosphoadenosine 5'-phosphosulfate sulfotransferase (PAPS reductase)/FAD synthetase
MTYFVLYKDCDGYQPLLGSDMNVDLSHFQLGSVPAFAGISGGRTSAFMGHLLDPRVLLNFQNTGREHPKTLDYLDELAHFFRRPITWLEFRPPRIKGAPPKDFEFAVVNYKTADRSGGPFRAMLEAVRDYRATKGLGPIAPWARSRICTAYLKHRVMDNYIRSLGIETYDSFIGLRRDEPDRVYRLKDRETANRGYRVPLFKAGITKPQVLAFWKAQSFDLQLEDYQGNCTACFLKDQSDIARVLGEPETDAAYWEAMERDFPKFGGQNFPGYVQLRKEGPVRKAMEVALRASAEPVNDGTLDPKRFRLVLLQEKRRLKGERDAFSCACEQSIAISDDETDKLALSG